MVNQEEMKTKEKPSSDWHCPPCPLLAEATRLWVVRKVPPGTPKTFFRSFTAAKATGPLSDTRIKGVTASLQCTAQGLCKGYRVCTGQETGWSQEQDLQMEKTQMCKD